MNSVLQGTPDSTLKTYWIKGKTYFRIYFEKKQGKPFGPYSWINIGRSH